MKLSDVENDLPMLLFYYEQVVEILETPTTRTLRKVSRKEVLAMFLENRSFQQTAAHFGVSRSAINYIVYTAFRTARRLVNLTPSPHD
jgi:DNA-directed RNA polymerase specialized sigma24 family protein